MEDRFSLPFLWYEPINLKQKQEEMISFEV